MSGPHADLEQEVAGWIGRRQQAHDRITARPADILAATFDRDTGPFAEGDPIPPAWHWLYFHEVVPLSQVGDDGHPARGGFLPPVPLPRRMWAGNRMQFHAPLRVGDEVQRESTVARAEVKSGASGQLCFVTVRHALSGSAGLATVEEHDIVYRSPPAPGERPRPGAGTGAGTGAPATRADWRREIEPDPVLLFRFSALTMNSHRIHYDREFCIQHEGYPGLLVHGPLTMLLLLDLFARHRPRASLDCVAVRATAPLYDTASLVVNGSADDAQGKATLWAEGPGSSLAMTAALEYRA